MLVLFALEPGNTVVLIPMVALVQLAMERDRRYTLLAGISVIPCVVISVLPFADDTGELVSVVLRNVAFCLLALAIGDVIRSQREAMARAVPRARRRRGASSARSGCASRARCTTWSRTRWWRSTCSRAWPRT